MRGSIMKQRLIAAILALAAPSLALAQPHAERGGSGHSAMVQPAERSGFAAGPVNRFGARDVERWRGGHWFHGERGHRLGWWWFAGGLWYRYAAPVYPYPDYVADDYATDGGPVWYRCENPPGFYPYLQSCPSGWETVPTAPTGDPPPPPLSSALSP